MNNIAFTSATGTPELRAASASPPDARIQLPNRVRARTKAPIAATAANHNNSTGIHGTIGSPFGWLAIHLPRASAENREVKASPENSGRSSLSDYYYSSGTGSSTGVSGGAAIMDAALRRKITFSDHSLATDSVFSEIHLITCRNVLIYFDHALQNRALGLFADSLVRGGFLGLGSKESLRFTEAADLFQDVAMQERIYRKKGLAP